MIESQIAQFNITVGEIEGVIERLDSISETVDTGILIGGNGNGVTNLAADRAQVVDESSVIGSASGNGEIQR